MKIYSLFTQYISDFANPKQVLFINQKGSAVLDGFFQRHLDEVKLLFKKNQKEFIYLPELLTPDYVSDLIGYLLPQYPKSLCPYVSSKITADSIYGLFMDFKEWRSRNPHVIFLGGEQEFWENTCPAPHTGLVITKSKGEIFSLTDCKSSNYSRIHTDVYEFASLEEADDNGIWMQLQKWVNHFCPVYTHSVAVQCNDDDPGCTVMHNCDEEILYNRYFSEGEAPLSDDQFPEEAYRLSQEILERVERLRMMGVNELIIKGLLEAKPELSSLNVTLDFRIVLPEYENREIVMSPLVKAVYLLFLKHPEGIMFKRISELEDELLEWYCKCCGRNANSDMRESVRLLVNPLSNSLNEKCSRIREAFLREMDDTLARHYYITGNRATPKRIILDRKMVKWEKSNYDSFMDDYFDL